MYLGPIQGADSEPEAKGAPPTSRGVVSPLPAEGPPTWRDPVEGGWGLSLAASACAALWSVRLQSLLFGRPPLRCH